MIRPAAPVPDSARGGGGPNSSSLPSGLAENGGGAGLAPSPSQFPGGHGAAGEPRTGSFSPHETNRPENLPERVASKVTVDPATGCWQWTAGCDQRGYGRISWDNKNRLAHRIVYELLEGAIPDDRELDHLCRNLACVNPEHLEPVTHRTNVIRGDASTRRTGRCRADLHDLTEDNLYIDPEGRRNCRECDCLARRRRAPARMLSDVAHKVVEGHRAQLDPAWREYVEACRHWFMWDGRCYWCGASR